MLKKVAEQVNNLSGMLEYELEQAAPAITVAGSGGDYLGDVCKHCWGDKPYPFLPARAETIKTEGDPPTTTIRIFKDLKPEFDGQNIPTIVELCVLLHPQDPPLRRRVIHLCDTCGGIFFNMIQERTPEMLLMNSNYGRP